MIFGGYKTIQLLNNNNSAEQSCKPILSFWVDKFQAKATGQTSTSPILTIRLMGDHNQPPAKSSSSQSTAMDILGPNQVTSTKPKISLEKEVDQYLSNPNSGSGMLASWQIMNVLSAICCFAKLYSGT